MQLRSRLGHALPWGILTGVLVICGAVCTPAAAGATPVPTTTVLASPVNPAVAGQAITFSATVSESPPGTVPTGSVTFDVGGVAASCGGGSNVEVLLGGLAQCATTLHASNTSAVVVATYLGDAGDASSTSNAVDQAVDVGSATVSVTSTAVVAPLTIASCAVVQGASSVTCPSTTGVTAGAAVTDTGSDLAAGTTVVKMSAGTVTLSAPAAGASAADSLTFVDNPTETYGSGHPGHFTASIVATAPATGVPSGQISWSVTSALGSTVACSNGQTVRVVKINGTAACIVPAGVLTAAGEPYSVVASYSGATNFGAGSGGFSQAINAAATKTFIAASPNPPLHGQPLTLSSAVVPSKFGGPPTGNVDFTFTSQPLKVAGCTTTARSATLRCLSGGLVSVGAGYAVTDVTSAGVLSSGTTATASTATSITLSQVANATASGQTILLTPDATPAITCDSGNSVPVSGGDATCSLSTGLPLLGSPFGIVATYVGDSSDTGSSSHSLTLRVH